MGNQQPQRKTIAIMPSKAITSTTASSTSSKVSSVAVTPKDDLKRQLDELQDEVERDRLALEQKLSKIKRMKAQLVNDEST